MLSRLQTSSQGKNFPLWSQLIKQALEEIYPQEEGQDRKEFFVQTLYYGPEVVIGMTHFGHKRSLSETVSLFVSFDLDTAEEESAGLKSKDKEITAIVNAIGRLWDEYIDIKSENWEFFPRWQKLEMAPQDLYWRSSRENLFLTYEANKILNSTLEDTAGQSENL